MMNKTIVGLILLSGQIIFCPSEGVDTSVKPTEESSPSTQVTSAMRFRWPDSMLLNKSGQKQADIDEKELDRSLEIAEQNKKSYEQSFSTSGKVRQLSPEEQEIINTKLKKRSLSKQKQEEYKNSLENRLLRASDYQENKSNTGSKAKRKRIVTIESEEESKLKELYKDSDAYVTYLDGLDESAIKSIDPKVLSETITQENFEKLLEVPNLLSRFTENQLQVIHPKIFSELSRRAVRKLFDQLEVLSKFTATQLKAISIERLLYLSNKNMEDISKHEDILSKFDQAQRIAMIRLDEIDKDYLRKLLTDPAYAIRLNSLSKKQIQEIDPKLLSDVLYDKLPKQLDKNFVEKLSLDQIITLHEDHLEWGFHNLRTSFKQNLTPDALEYINQQVKNFEGKRIQREAEIKKLEKEIAHLEKQARG